MLSLWGPPAKATAVNTQKDKIRAAAQKYLQKGQIDKAIREFERLVEDDPSDVRTLLKIGDLQARMDNTPAAIATYTRVAEYYAEQGFFLKAIAVYKQVLTLAPDQLAVCRKLAETYVQLGLVSDAINQYRQLCNLCESQGLWEDCIAAAERLVVLDAANIAGRIKLAEMQARAGREEEAVVGFRAAAVELERGNRHEEWAKVLERVLQLAPTDAESCQALAGYYLNHDDPKRALGKLQIAFKVNAQDPATLSLLAEVFEALEQPQKALSALRELALQQRTLHDHVGWEKTLRNILRLSPEDAEARELLGAHAEKSQSAARRAAVADDDVIAVEPMEDDEGILQSEIIDADDIIEADAVSAEAADDGEDPVDKMLTEADIYIKYGLRDKAIEHLDRVLLAHPNHREAQSRYRKVLQAAGDTQGGQARLLLMAQQAEAQGHMALATGDVQALLQVDPKHTEGQALLRRLQNAEAADAPATEPSLEIDVDIEVDIDMEGALAAAAEATDVPLASAHALGVFVTDAPTLELDAGIELVLESQVAEEAPIESGFEALPTEFVQAPAYLPAKRHKVPIAPPPAPAADLGPMNLAFEPSGSAAGLDLGTSDKAPAASWDTQEGDFTSSRTMIDHQISVPSALRRPAPTAEPQAPAAVTKAFVPQASVAPAGAAGSEVAQAPVEMMAELYEVRFFVKQGLFTEAREALKTLSRSHPSNTEIRSYGKEIDQAEAVAATMPDEAHAPQGQSGPDLADELADLTQSLNRSDADLNSAFDNVFDEFGAQGPSVQQEDAGREVATHFDLGIAYKEMGMLAEAIAEFEHTTPFAQYEVNACTMLGLCHLEMGHTEEALIAFRRGLGSPQITPQEATALRYEVGLAYESMGQIVDALKFYEKTYEMDASFRDVAQRLKEAKAATADSQEASSSDLDVLLDDASSSNTDNKVSFF